MSRYLPHSVDLQPLRRAGEGDILGTKPIALLVAALATVASVGSAQEADPSGVGPVDATSTEPVATPAQGAASGPGSEEEESRPYSKRVQGLLWFEFLIGPTWFDPDQYGAVSLPGGGQLDAPRQFGPEWGVAVGVALRGFHLGASYRRAKYDGYKLLRLGVDMKGIFRFVPYVHPMLRLNLYYAGITDGNPYPQLTNANIDGGGFTLGAGVMVPIVRWVSFTTTFDWSLMGLAVRGNSASGASVRSGVAGQEVGVTFALTFHFIGVRAH